VGEAGEDSEVDYDEGHTKEVVEAEEVEKNTGGNSQGGEDTGEEVECFDFQQESEETEGDHKDAEGFPATEDDVKDIEKEPTHEDLLIREDDIENSDDLPPENDLPMREKDLKDSEENLDLQELPQTFDEVEKAIKESEEQLDLTEVPQTFDEVEKALKESEERLDLSEIPQTFDEVEKALKESEEQLDLSEIPQTLDEVERAISEEQLDLSEVPKSIDELNALEDYQNKNIVKDAIHNIMRMSPEQRERHGLSREYTNHELNIFFAQNDPPSTLDSNKTKPSEVSNPEDSGPFSRNDSFDRKSEDLKKESVNKTKEEEMPQEEKESPLIINDKEKLSERESAQDLLKIQKEEILRGTDNGSDVKNVIKHEDNIDLTEIPKDIFSKEKYGYHCKDINLVKKIYEAQESFPKTGSYLKNQCCKNVPGSLTIRNLIIKSFKSYSKYKIWIHNVRLRRSINRVPEEKRKAIIEVGTAENHCPLNKLCEEFKVTNTTARGILVRAKGEDWFKEEYPSPEKISDEKRKAIIEAGTAENHDSLRSLAEEFKVAKGTARRILVEAKGKDWYKKEYSPPKRISEKKREAIIEVGTAENHSPLNKLCEEFNISGATARGILIEAKGKDWYKKEYPSPEKISDEKRKVIIEAGTAKNHNSLNKLCEKFKVSIKTAREILIEEKGEAWYEEEYPPPERISDEKREAIIEASTAENHGSLTSLAEELKTTFSSIRKFLVEAKGEDWVKDEFPQDLPIEKGRLTHNLVKSHITKVFDERRKYFPEVPEMISEPPIYSGSSKSADIGFKNIPNYFQELLAKNDLFQRLNIKPENIKHIKFVQFDFTNSATKENIIKKATKYQHHKVLTFIVGTFWRREDSTINIPKEKAIMYPENLKVISYELFADLLDLQGAERDEFMEIIKLNEGNKIEALREMWEMRKNQELHYAKEDLKGFLDNNANLDFWMD